MKSILEIFIFTNLLLRGSLRGASIGPGDVNLMMNYLNRFGYLPSITSGKLPLLSQEGFEKSIKHFQSYVGLDITGVVDEQTLEFLKTPRCSLPDITSEIDSQSASPREKRYALQGSRWKKRRLTYKVGRYPSKLSRAEVDADVGKAFKMWAKASGLTFVRKYSGNVDIEIRFENYYHGDEDAFDGPGGMVAHAFFPEFGGDAHFDNKELWTVNKYTVMIISTVNLSMIISLQGTNLLQATLHEIGHSLGLQHSNVSKAMMAPYYRGWDPFMSLSEDDVAAVKDLYGDIAKSQDTKTRRKFLYFPFG